MSVSVHTGCVYNIGIIHNSICVCKNAHFRLKTKRKFHILPSPSNE